MTLNEKLMAYFEENEEDFNAAIEELDSYNGYLGDDRIETMDFLNEIFSGQDVDWILARAFYGHDADTWTTDSHGEKEYGPFNPNRDYFYFNGYGNLVSTDYKDYSDKLDDWFIDSLIENAGHLYLPDEVTAIIEGTEEEEEEEEAE